MVKKSRRRGVGADGAAGRNETNLKAMWKYIRPYLHLALIAALFMVGEVLMDLIQPGLMRTIVDDGVLGVNNGGRGHELLRGYAGAAAPEL